MKREEVLKQLQEKYEAIANYGVKSLALFGSVARNEATENSDIDILVEFEGKITFDRYMDLKFYLEDRLGKKVDLVSRKMLNPLIREKIEREAIDVS